MKQPTTLFGRRLKAARTKAGVSQKQLGIKIGMDVSVASARMNQYEVGSHSPKFDTAQRIAKALDAPTSYFYEDDAAVADAILMFGRLNRVDQKKVLAFIGELSTDG